MLNPLSRRSFLGGATAAVLSLVFPRAAALGGPVLPSSGGMKPDPTSPEEGRLATAAKIARFRHVLAREHHVDINGERLDLERWPDFARAVADPSPEILMAGEFQAGRTEALLIHAFACALSGMRVVYAVPTVNNFHQLVKQRVDPLLHMVPAYMTAREQPANHRHRFVGGADGSIIFAPLSTKSDLHMLPIDALCLDLGMEPAGETANYLFRDRMVASPYRLAMVAGFFGGPKGMSGSCHYLRCPLLRR